MRLGLLAPFSIPVAGVLSSNSLNVFDVFIGDRGFIVDLMLVMDVPHLTDLTLRTSYYLGSILRCAHIFGRLTRFALHGAITGGQPLFSLFDSMPLLEVLDLRRTKYHVLQTYLLWTFTVNARSLRAFKLRSLTAGVVDLPSLVEFVRYHGAEDSRSGSHIILRHVRVDHKVRNWQQVEFEWMGEHITDFGATPYVHYPVSQLSGPTTHSLFEFL
jgi:hypothetical protein